MIHAVHTSHPPSGIVVRLASRWLAAHLLSDLIPFEAIELMVAHVFTNRAVPWDVAGSATVGFMRFLHLLAHHDWARYVSRVEVGLVSPWLNDCTKGDR